MEWSIVVGLWSYGTCVGVVMCVGVALHYVSVHSTGMWIPNKAENVVGAEYSVVREGWGGDPGGMGRGGEGMEWNVYCVAYVHRAMKRCL